MAENINKMTCDWLFSTLVVLCDGKVVCGCADPNGERPLGHLKENSIYEIWNSEKVQKIRADLNNGHSPFCRDCGLKQYVDQDYEIPQKNTVIETLPKLFLEPTIACNISCFNSVCNQTSGIVSTREIKRMPFDMFKSLIDEVGPKLEQLDFYNYGEPFAHPQAIDMIEYIKKEYPHIYLFVSTNGLLLTGERIRRLIDANLDEITFSVDGPDQETYTRYRQNGDFNLVMETMKKFVTQRNMSDKARPIINWRYILFRWNDSNSKMNKARKLARKIGVDRLVWEITDHPKEAVSEKYQVGTPAWKKIFNETWVAGERANAIKNKRYKAKIKILTPKLKVGTDEPFIVDLKIKNAGEEYWWKAAVGWKKTIRLGAQLFDKNKKMIDMDYHREFLPEDIKQGKVFHMNIKIPGLNQPGKYFLKFDLVSEGITWFEQEGSRAAWKEVTIY